MFLNVHEQFKKNHKKKTLLCSNVDFCVCILFNIAIGHGNI